VLGLLLRLCSVTNPSHNEGADKLRMPKSKMQCSEAAHRESYHVRRAVAHVSYDICQILRRSDLIVGA